MDSGAPIQVICAGFIKTGNSSLKKAMEMLYKEKCYYLSDVVEKNTFKEWKNFIEAYKKNGNFDKVKFETLLDNCKYAADLPVSIMIEEIIKTYPNVKVVVSLKDFDKWLVDIRKDILPKKMVSSISNYLARSWLSPVKKLDDFIGFCLTTTFGRVDLTDDKILSDMHLEHIKRIQSVVPNDRLFKYDPEDGWEPLCNFLQTKEPRKLFPFENKKEDISIYYNQLNSRASKVTLIVRIFFIIAVAALAVLLHKNLS